MGTWRRRSRWSSRRAQHQGRLPRQRAVRLPRREAVRTAASVTIARGSTVDQGADLVGGAVGRVGGHGDCAHRGERQPAENVRRRSASRNDHEVPPPYAAAAEPLLTRAPRAQLLAEGQRPIVRMEPRCAGVPFDRGSQQTGNGLGNWLPHPPSLSDPLCPEQPSQKRRVARGRRNHRSPSGGESLPRAMAPRWQLEKLGSWRRPAPGHDQRPTVI